MSKNRWHARLALFRKIKIANWVVRTNPLISVTYHLDLNPIPLADTCKDLGVISSSDLSWSQHYSTISAPIKPKKTLYLALVWSQLTYCSQIWMSHFIKDIMITSLERIQWWATKFILWVINFSTKSQEVNSWYCLIMILEYISPWIYFLKTKFILNDFTIDYCSRLISLNLLRPMYFFKFLDILFFIMYLKFPDPSFLVQKLRLILHCFYKIWMFHQT